MKTVLIIEDDDDTLHLLEEMAKMAEVQVILRSKVVSLREIEEINPTLILLDHWLDSQLGGDFCLKIKQNEKMKDIAVVLLSCDKDIGQIAMANSADGAFEKPFDINELLAVIDVYVN